MKSHYRRRNRQNTSPVVTESNATQTTIPEGQKNKRRDA